MRKRAEFWTIDRLSREFLQIHFPEYQREPNIWSRSAKQRLIDSILRQFDVASLYFNKKDGRSLECIDGRQRINAIMSFLGDNPEDAEDNGFALRISNEIYEEEEKDKPFAVLDGLTYETIQAHAEGHNAAAKSAVSRLMKYKLTVVLLSQTARPAEFNLQFTRLNLGTLINAGEKLHAMIGEMRDFCFEDIGEHPFLEMVKIPTLRYAKESLAAQILAQVFSKKGEKRFTRTRYFDLQKFLKQYAEINDTQRLWIRELETTLDALAEVLPEAGEYLRNRAVTVSVVLVAWERKLFLPSNRNKLQGYRDFLDAFLCRLRWQVDKGLDVDVEYRYLIDFQRHLTQASVEKPAVEARHTTLLAEFDRWSNESELQGDAEFKQRLQKDPDELCREEVQKGGKL